jgi:hypothetical protein
MRERSNFSPSARDYLVVGMIVPWFHRISMAQDMLIHSSDLQSYLLRLDCTNTHLMHAEIEIAFIAV